MEYTKVQCKGKGKFPVIRYIDNSGNWLREEMNGHIHNSVSMPIIKDYGKVELNIISDEVFGLRIS